MTVSTPLICAPLSGAMYYCTEVRDTTGKGIVLIRQLVSIEANVIKRSYVCTSLS